MDILIVLKTKETFTSQEYQNAYLYIIAFVLLIFLIKYISSKSSIEGVARLKTKFIKPKSLHNAHEILFKYFPYYRNLKKDLQTKFIRRLEVFMDLKEIITRQSEENPTVNILIGASAVQLTFGLKDFRIYSFKRILIYPDAYYNKIRKAYHKGEVNVKQRLIVLSAKHFLEGIKIDDDGLNLGLHEMAHALNIEAFEEQHEEFKYFFSQWEKLAEQEIENIKLKNTHFLRKYAATNIQEMFAVCTEFFFEKADEFDKQLPKLYKAMCNVYKQNPSNHSKPIKN